MRRMVFLTFTSAEVVDGGFNAIPRKQLASVKDSVPVFSGLKRRATVTTVRTDVNPCDEDCVD